MVKEGSEEEKEKQRLDEISDVLDRYQSAVSWNHIVAAIPCNDSSYSQKKDAATSRQGTEYLSNRSPGRRSLKKAVIKSHGKQYE